MLLWRLCDIKEEQAILKNDFEKLTFGSPLWKYVFSFGINYYPQFRALMNEVENLEGDDDQIKPILKMFPYLPKELPLFENEDRKQREIKNKFVPYNQYKAYPGKYVFLNSIKVAGFFDTFWKVPYITKKFCYENYKLMAVNIPDKIALKYKGYGEYKRDYKSFVYPEYAIPLYRLKPEYLNLNKLTEEEYNKLYNEARERGEKIFTENIFKDKMPYLSW